MNLISDVCVSVSEKEMIMKLGGEVGIWALSRKDAVLDYEYDLTVNIKDFCGLL